VAERRKFKYLIIGNSAGAIGAIEAIRAVDKEGTLAIVSDEPYPAYSRPLISEYLAEHYPFEKMLYRPAGFYEQSQVQTFFGKKVSKLEVKAHSIILDDGQKISFEKLLLATGGTPIVPPTKGGDKKGVFTFTTIDDAKAIDTSLTPSSRAVVIGGGLIGVSVSEALVMRGVSVTVIELKDRILNTILDAEGSAQEAAALEKAGVSIITGRTVAEINSKVAGNNTVSSVTLDDGTRIPCEMVIVAIGVRPRVELAAASGLKVNRGIVVDRAMGTSSPDIYACGDAAEAFEFIYGENRLTPIWPNAYLGGRIAGLNMAGQAAEYSGGTAMNSMKYFSLDVASAGIITSAETSLENITYKRNGIYRKIVLQDGVIIGMVLVGDIARAGIILGLMKDRVDVSKCKQVIVSDNFSLISLPEDRWRSRLAMAPVK
jgi:NAD(P)H-nitrite reductase large subunit